MVNPRLAPKRRMAIPSEPTHQTVVNPLIREIDADLYESNLVAFTSFPNRYYTSQTGVEAANWLYNAALTIAANRSDVTVSKFTHTFAQPSIIAKILGTGSNPQEIVIIGAHQDSIAPGMPSGFAPGVNDDGSGSIAVLEVFRILVQAGFRPQNTIEFQWYAAEEVGLLGSQAIAQSYQDNEVLVRSMIQLDMVGYDQVEQVVGVITDYTDAASNVLIRSLTDEYLNITWSNTLCGYACSDHASWDRAGYAATHPYEATIRGGSPYLHTTSDTLSRMSVPHALEFVKLALGFAVELSYD